MAKLSVLLDSCVLFPMYLRDLLLSTAEAGLYLPYWSQEILDGATRNLVITGRMTVERVNNLEVIIKESFPEAIVEVAAGLAERMTNHPGDRHVLAAAVSAKANIIVTSNLRHFQENDLAPWQIKALSPDAFLTELYNDYPDDMVAVVRRQCKRLKKPPMTILELLNLLSKEVPKFISNVLFDEYHGDILQTAKKALKKCGKEAPEGGKFLEGERYRLWQKGRTLTISAKDGRGEIIRVQDEEIEGVFSVKDVEAFQLIAQNL